MNTNTTKPKLTGFSFKVEKRNCISCGAEHEHHSLTIGGGEDLASGMCEKCEEEHERSAEEASRVEKMKVRAEKCVPKIYRNTDVNHADYPKNQAHKQAMKWVKSYLSGSNENVFFGLQGPSGICKTRVLAMMAKRLIYHGKNIKWVISTQFEWCCSNEFNDQNKYDASRHLKSYLNCEVLVFDDMGAMKFTEAGERKFFNLIEHRASNDLPILWTSNETFDEMGARSNMTPKQKSRIVSRLDGYSEWWVME